MRGPVPRDRFKPRVGRRGTGPRPTVLAVAFRSSPAFRSPPEFRIPPEFRSAGACPPLSFSIARTLARDRPSPYGPAGAFRSSPGFRSPPGFRSAGACPPLSFPTAFTSARDRPSPYGPSGAFRSSPWRFVSRRSFVVRGPVPRYRSQPRLRRRGTGPRPTVLAVHFAGSARDRPSHYGIGRAFRVGRRGTGPRPTALNYGVKHIHSLSLSN